MCLGAVEELSDAQWEAFVAWHAETMKRPRCASPDCHAHVTKNCGSYCPLHCQCEPTSTPETT